MKRSAWTLCTMLLALVMLVFIGQAEPAHAEGLWLYEPEKVDDTIVGWMITGYEGSTASLVIPEKIDGIPVTIIGKRAFANDTSLTYLTIPETVKTIQAEAFAGCTMLQQVNYNAASASVPDPWIYDGNRGVGVFSGAGSNVDGGFKVVFGPEVTSVPAYLFATASIDVYGKKGYDYAHVGQAEFSSSIAFVGNAAFRNCDDLTSVTFGSGVTEIRDAAFRYCGALKELTFSDALHTIGVSAFQDCIALTDITWGTELDSIGNSAFASCTALTELSLPNPLRSLGNYAFNGCTGLRTITLNKSLNHLGGSCFAGCKKLAKLTINSAELTVPDVWIYSDDKGVGVFSGAGSANEDGFSVTFGNAVKYVPTNLFDTASLSDYGHNGSDYAHVTSARLSSSVTEIGIRAFQACRDLIEITMGENLTRIGSYAFYDCSMLTDITWGDSLDVIETGAFALCTSLTSVSIPSPTRTVGVNAFNGCTGLRTVTLPQSLTNLQAQAFINCKKLTKLTINCRELTVPEVWIYDTNRGAGVFSGAGSAVEGGFTVVFGEKVQFIPANIFATASIDDYGHNGSDYAHVGQVEMSDSITYVGVRAFRACRDLEEITLGAKVARLDNRAFYGCTALNTVNLSQALQTIDEYAFAYCSALTEVNWGASLDTIGSSAFISCTALESIAIPSPARSIGYQAFRDCTALTHVALPETLTTLKAEVFYNCRSLRQLDFDCISASVPSVWIHDSNRGAGVFSGAGSAVEEGFTVTFGDKVQIIPPSLFDTASTNEYGLKGHDFAHVGAVEMSASIQEIGTLAFRSCRKLAKVTLGSGVQTVGASAFQYCIGLTGLNLTNCMALGDSAFRDCTLLSSINWGTKLDKIGAHAFRSCTSLVRVNLPSPLTNIGVAAFAHCTALTNVVLPESLSYLGGEAFYNAAALERLEINSRSLTAAGVWTHASDRGAGVFSGAGSASGGFYAVFGPEVTAIPANLFLTASLNSNGMKGYDYAHVTYAFIPANVTTIGENAFRNCRDMSRITFMHTADSALTINAVAFQVDTPTATTLHVPDADAMNAALTGYDWAGKNRTATPAAFAVRTMDMPAALTQIGAEAFLNSIPQSATLHEGVTTVGENAFANSPVLHLVHLPASLKDIPASAFASSPWAVILCPAGSAAQAFAQANGIYYVTGQ